MFENGKIFIFEGPQDYPDITICPFPSYDQPQMLSQGYGQSFEYAKGILNGRKLKGWSGNGSKAVDEIIEDISILKSPEDCPLTRVVLLHSNSENFVPIQMKLTRVMHPGGRCCQALVPNDAHNSTIGGLTFRVDLENNLPLVDGFQIFLSNRESANHFHRKKFNIDGVELKASTKELGYMLYNLKTFKEIFLDTNGKFNCKNYDSGGEYSQCLESNYQGIRQQNVTLFFDLKNILEQMLNILNCTPPWITDKHHLWCKDLLNLSSSASKKLDFFLSSIINDRGDKSNCPQSCSSTW